MYSQVYTNSINLSIPQFMTPKDTESLNQRMVRKLWRNAPWGSLWTPNGGECGEKKWSCFFPSDAKVFVPAGWQEKHVYFGVNPATERRERWEAITKNTLACANALFADWDGKDETDPTEEGVQVFYDQLRNDPGNARTSDEKLWNQAIDMEKERLFLLDIPTYKSAALDKIRGLPIRPSLLWDSGGGYHGIFLLRDTFYLDSAAQVEKLEHIQREWVKYVGADEEVFDLRRILRWPGTQNRKGIYAPDYPTVAYVWADFDTEYDLDELAGLLPAAPEPTEDDEVDAKGDNNSDSKDLLISLFNAAISQRWMLTQYGYTIHGDVLSRPNQPESKGVKILDDNTSYHWSTNDELRGRPKVSPYDTWVCFAWDGDSKAAYDYLRATIFGNVRLWVRTTSFAELIPADKKSTRVNRETGVATLVYVTDSTDTKVADALIDLMEKAGRLGASVGKKRLGSLAGVSANTAVAALNRMSGWLFDVEPSEYGAKVTFAADFRAEHINPLFRQIAEATKDTVAAQMVNEYSPRKAEDAFLSGTSKQIKRVAGSMASTLTESAWETMLAHIGTLYGDEAQKVSSHLHQYGNDNAFGICLACNVTEGSLSQLVSCNLLVMSDSGVYDVADEYKPEDIGASEVLRDSFLPSLGESGLRILDALLRCGEMVAQELADETGKKVSAVRVACKKLINCGLIHGDREKATDPLVYTVADEVWDTLDALAPTMRTWTIGAQREDIRLRDAQRWAIRAYKTARTEDKPKLERKLASLSRQRVPLLMHHLADQGLTLEMVKDIAYKINLPAGPHPTQERKMERLHGEARIDLAAQKRSELPKVKEDLAQAAQTLLEFGVQRWQLRSKLTFAGYDRELVNHYIDSISPKQVSIGVKEEV